MTRKRCTLYHEVLLTYSSTVGMLVLGLGVEIEVVSGAVCSVASGSHVAGLVL